MSGRSCSGARPIKIGDNEPIRRAAALREAAAKANAQRRGSVIQGEAATNRCQAPTTRAVNGNVTEHPVYLVKRAGGTNAPQAVLSQSSDGDDQIYHFV